MFFSKFHKSKGVMRWFALICGFLFFTTAYFQGEIKEAIIAFSIGMLCGFSIDLIGVKKFHFWNYPRQPFLGKKYWHSVCHRICLHGRLCFGGAGCSETLSAIQFHRHTFIIRAWQVVLIFPASVGDLHSKPGERGI